MAKIISGIFNQNIEIYRQDNESNGSGGTIPLDVLYWTTSASTNQVKAARTLQALQDILSPSVAFTVRYRTDKHVTPDMRIKWRGHYFTITTAEVDFVNKQYMTIIARAAELPGR